MSDVSLLEESEPLLAQYWPLRDDADNNDDADEFFDVTNDVLELQALSANQDQAACDAAGNHSDDNNEQMSAADEMSSDDVSLQYAAAAAADEEVKEVNVARDAVGAAATSDDDVIGGAPAAADAGHDDADDEDDDDDDDEDAAGVGEAQPLSEAAVHELPERQEVHVIDPLNGCRPKRFDLRHRVVTAVFVNDVTNIVLCICRSN